VDPPRFTVLTAAASVTCSGVGPVLALDSWLKTNGGLIENFLDERYQDAITTEEGRDSVGVECTAQLPKGPLSEAQIVEAAWNGTKVVQQHCESGHGAPSFEERQDERISLTSLSAGLVTTRRARPD
jgi:hypothetical protein